MNKMEYLLTVLSEECAEVSQRACKAIRFGLSEVQPGQGEDNKRRLERELADLEATAELLGLKIRDEDKVAKKKKLAKYMAYSQEVGTLKNDGRKVPNGLKSLKRKKVVAFSLQKTVSFPDGAPQRESYLSDKAYFRAEDRYIAEWKAEYECAGCSDSVCPQCGK